MPPHGEIAPYRLGLLDQYPSQELHDPGRALIHRRGIMDDSTLVTLTVMYQAAGLDGPSLAVGPLRIDLHIEFLRLGTVEMPAVR